MLDSQIDDAAETYLANSLSDNLVIYGTARIINSLISVIQSVEVSFSLGAGIAVNLGEALDPLNDLIERFSGFVLYALASIALQQIVLVASASTAIKVITSGALAAGFLFWARSTVPDWFKRLLLLIILARFALPIEVGISWSLDQLYFNAHQHQAVSTLNIAQERLQSIRDQYVSALEDSGVLGGLWSTTRDIIGTDANDGVTDLAATAIVQLIVIMLVKSTLLPLVFLWLLFVAFRKLLP